MSNSSIVSKFCAMPARIAVASLGVLMVAPPGANAQELAPPPQTATSPSPRGLSVAPVLKTTTTVLGQPLSYVATQAPEVSSAVQTYQPGGETGWHYHLSSSHIYVLEGTLTLDVIDNGSAAKPREFTVGQAYMETVKVWHNARNAGLTPLKLLVVTFGEKDTSNNIFRKAP